MLCKYIMARSRARLSGEKCLLHRGRSIPRHNIFNLKFIIDSIMLSSNPDNISKINNKN